MGNEPGQGPLARQLVLSLYVPAIMLALGTSMIAPVIPVFARSFDVSLSTAAFVFVATPLGAMVGTFPTGILMDKIGRRPVLLVGPLVAGIVSFLTPFAGSFEMLLVYRFIAGFASQSWMQARLAVITDTAAYDQRARQINYMGGMARAGQLFGPSIGGLLAGSIGIWVPFTLHGVLTLLSTIPSFFLVKETAPGKGQRVASPQATPAGETPAEPDPGWRGILSYMLTTQMLIFLAVQVFANMSRGGAEHGALNLYAVYAYGAGPEVLGLLASAALVFSLPVPFLTGYLMDRFSRRAVIAPAFALYGLGLLAVTANAFLSLPFSAFLIAYIVVEATQGTTNGSMQVLGSDHSPAFARGRFFAVWRLIAQIGTTLSPALFALSAEHISYGAGFLMLASFALAVTVLVGGCLREPQGRKGDAFG